MPVTELLNTVTGIEMPSRSSVGDSAIVATAKRDEFRPRAVCKPSMGLEMVNMGCACGYLVLVDHIVASRTPTIST